MNGLSKDLEKLERWMQTVITHPRGVRAGVASGEARRHIDTSVGQIERVVNRSNSLSAIDCLGVYGRSYFARLQECLRAEFSVLLHALGEDLFNRFALDYLNHYPPRSYTLNRLGENFPRYFAETRPNADRAPDKRESWPDFITDLARLERAFSEVFDGPGAEWEKLPDVDRRSSWPDELLLNARFRPAACFRLLNFRYPVALYFHAVRNKQDPELPAPADTFLCMTRRDYVVRLHELSRPQHALLRELMKGRTLAQAVTKDKTVSDGETATTDAMKWLRDWLTRGFFLVEVT